MEVRLEIIGDVPKKVKIFVRRHFERWITAAAGTPLASLERAVVSLDRVGRGHVFSCSIRVELRSGAVRGEESGLDLHQVFDACLLQLEEQLMQGQIGSPVGWAHA